VKGGGCGGFRGGKCYGGWRKTSWAPDERCGDSSLEKWKLDTKGTKRKGNTSPPLKSGYSPGEGEIFFLGGGKGAGLQGEKKKKKKLVERHQTFKEQQEKRSRKTHPGSQKK